MKELRVTKGKTIQIELGQHYEEKRPRYPQKYGTREIVITDVDSDPVPDTRLPHQIGSTYVTFRYTHNQTRPQERRMMVFLLYRDWRLVDLEPPGTWDCAVEGKDGCTIPRYGHCTARCTGEDIDY